MMRKPKDNKHPKLYFAFSFAPRQSFQKLLFAKKGPDNWLPEWGGQICEFTTRPDKTYTAQCTYFYPHHKSHCKITWFQSFVILNIHHSKISPHIPKDQENLLPEAAIFASPQQNRTKLHQNLHCALTSIHTTQVIAKPLKLFFREKTLAF